MTKKIVFMGTPEFAVNSLEALNEDPNISVELVITGKDKIRGRNKLLPTKVKEKALELGIKSYEPDNVNSEDSLELINCINPDFIVVVAYGQMIGDQLLENYKDRIINIHSSILPKYRGAAPMQWAILNKDSKTGVSTMLIEKSMDTGDVLDIAYMDLTPETSINEVHDQLSFLSRQLIVDTINNYDDLYAHRTKQDHSQATYSKKITKEMGHIKFDEKAEDIQAKIMAFSSWPSTYVVYKDEKVKIHKIDIIDKYTNDEIGKIFACDDQAIYVNCLDKCIAIKEIQFPGKRRMSIEDYLRGNSIDIGVHLQ